MTKIERLKLRFASGMSEGRISSDEWELEFLPMIEDAERLAYFFSDDAMESTVWRDQDVQEVLQDIKSWREAIDLALTPTKE